MLKPKNKLVAAFEKDGSVNLKFKNMPSNEELSASYRVMVALAVAITGTTDITLNELVARVEQDASKTFQSIIDGEGN